MNGHDKPKELLTTSSNQNDNSNSEENKIALSTKHHTTLNESSNSLKDFAEASLINNVESLKEKQPKHTIEKSYKPKYQSNGFENESSQNIKQKNPSNKFFCSNVDGPDDPIVDIASKNIFPSQLHRLNNGFTQQLKNLEHPKKHTFASFVSLACYGYEPRFPGPLIKLNVSGTSFLVKLNTLRRDPMVYEKFLEDAEWISDTNEYYLERDPVVFRYVHSYLRYQELHLPPNMCGPLLEKELELWGLQLGFDLQRCCLGPVMDSKSKLESLNKFEKEFTETKTKTSNCCINDKWQRIQAEVWRVIGDTPKKQWLNISNPNIVSDCKTDEFTQNTENKTNHKCCESQNQTLSSRIKTYDENNNATEFNYTDANAITQNLDTIDILSREDNKTEPSTMQYDNVPHNWRQLQFMPKRIIFGRIYISLQVIIVCSLNILLFLTYIPALRVPFGPTIDLNATNGILVQPNHTFHTYRMYFAFNEQENRLTKPNNIIIILDWICVILFTIDLIARCIFCPNILRWISSIYTITDVISLIPFYVEIFMYLKIFNYPNDTEHANLMISNMKTLDIVLLLKIFVSGRLFRLLQRQRATRVLLYTVRTTASNMLMIFELMLLCSVFFGTAIFFLDNRFNNIFEGIWWALITMATVGYGDIVPSTFVGYTLAIVCVFVGILLTSYTIPILVNDFLLYYSHSDQLAWMRRVHTTATAKRKLERRDLLTKRRMSRVRAILKNTLSDSRNTQTSFFR